MLARNLGLSLCSFQKCSMIIYLQNTRAQMKSWRSGLKASAFRQHLVHHWSVCIIIQLQSQRVIHVFLIRRSLRPNCNLLNHILTLIFACRMVHEQKKKSENEAITCNLHFFISSLNFLVSASVNFTESMWSKGFVLHLCHLTAGLVQHSKNTRNRTHGVLLCR